ncbi:MAG: hypothetical protein F6J93_06980 [Oscillatoria sp. SIO1A7]|nr:hypothetical protein [Oscillatoria sp. SIO1A7]
MSNSNWLDSLILNPDSDRSVGRNLSREELFVLAWFMFNQKDRTFENMARECKLSEEQCQGALQELIRAEIIRFR